MASEKLLHVAWNLSSPKAAGTSFHCGAPLGGEPQASPEQHCRRQWGLRGAELGVGAQWAGSSPACQRREAAPPRPPPAADLSPRAGPANGRSGPACSAAGCCWAGVSASACQGCRSAPVGPSRRPVPSREVSPPACRPRDSAGRVPLRFPFLFPLLVARRAPRQQAVAGRTALRSAGGCRAARGESAGVVRVPHRAMLCVPRWPRRRQATGWRRTRLSAGSGRPWRSGSSGCPTWGRCPPAASCRPRRARVLAGPFACEEEGVSGTVLLATSGSKGWWRLNSQSGGVGEAAEDGPRCAALRCGASLPVSRPWAAPPVCASGAVRVFCWRRSNGPCCWSRGAVQYCVRCGERCFYPAFVSSTNLDVFNTVCFLQEIHVFQCVNKESSSSRELSFLYYWPKWESSSCAGWQVWLPVPVPQASKVTRVLSLFFLA